MIFINILWCIKYNIEYAPLKMYTFTNPKLSLIWTTSRTGLFGLWRVYCIRFCFSNVSLPIYIYLLLPFLPSLFFLSPPSLSLSLSLWYSWGSPRWRSLETRTSNPTHMSSRTLHTRSFMLSLDSWRDQRHARWPCRTARDGHWDVFISCRTPHSDVSFSLSVKVCSPSQAEVHC